MSTRRLSARPWRSAAADQQRVKDLNKPQRRKLYLSQAESEKKKTPTTSLQSVCCHQEKWRSVHSHTDKKDVTARWVPLHLKAFVCQMLAAAFDHGRQLRHCCAADPLQLWSQCLARTCATAEHLPSCFHFLLFLCAEIALWGRKWCNVSV